MKGNNVFKEEFLNFKAIIGKAEIIRKLTVIIMAYQNHALVIVVRIQGIVEYQ